MKKIAVLFIIYISSIGGVFSQTRGGITTATPFLLIVPDARAGAMGDIGVSTSADASSLFHNPSKIAFSGRQVMIGVNYSPWMRNLTDDIFIGSASYINRFSENAAWGTSVGADDHTTLRHDISLNTLGARTEALHHGRHLHQLLSNRPRRDRHLALFSQIFNNFFNPIFGPPGPPRGP